MDFKAIGTRIRQRRKVEGLTQEELAQKAGLSTMSIRRYEAGERIIPKEAIQSIATSLGTEPFTLVGSDWWDLQIGPEGVKELNRAIAAERGIIAMLEEIYGSVEQKEVLSEGSTETGHYYLVGKAPNNFVLYDGDIDALEQATKASLPALIDRMKDTRPENEVIQTYQKELDERFPIPQK